jgi:carbonic anhydrase/acetyltransferase-like protein (isoleucine patch superfamily)
MKRVICTVPLLAAVFCSSASAGLIGSAESFTVLANTYVSGGDGSIVHGSVIAKTYASTGANSTINGDFRSGDVMTLGDGATVTGNAQSIEAGSATANTTVNGNLEVGGVGTMGDTSHVKGNFISGLDGTIGANGILDGNWEVGAGSVAAASASSNKVNSDAVDTNVPYLNSVKQAITSDMIAATNDLETAKTSLSAMGLGTALAPTMTVDTTFYAGVYSAASWSTTAGTTLTLDGQNQVGAMWVFNIEDILAFGGVSTVELINVDDTAEVWWNVKNLTAGGYTSIGDGAHIVGTIIAEDYVMIGANAHVMNVSNTNCAGVYSTTSYVSIGANAVVGGAGCSGTNVPEPETYTLFLSGLGLMGFGFITRRRTKKTTKIA